MHLHLCWLVLAVPHALEAQIPGCAPSNWIDTSPVRERCYGLVSLLLAIFLSSLLLSTLICLS